MRLAGCQGGPGLTQSGAGNTLQKKGRTPAVLPKLKVPRIAAQELHLEHLTVHKNSEQISPSVERA